MGTPAGLLRRLGAILYDSLLLFALWALVTVPFVAIRGGESVDASSGVLQIVYRITLLLVAYGFFVGFWTTKGRTLGMQSWGLQLQGPDGRVPGPALATIRFLASLLSWAPLGLGFVWQLWDRDRLAWHDRLSHTRLMHYPRDAQRRS